jgi:hypothetical protein
MEPLIEHKNPHTQMQRMESAITTNTQKARELLHALERALVRCGHVRDTIYNSHVANFTSRRERGVVLYWTKGCILWGSGLLPKERGEPPRERPRISVDDMDAGQILRVAQHLSPFVDHLEGHTRHLCARLMEAVNILEAMVEKIQDDPHPPAS